MFKIEDKKLIVHAEFEGKSPEILLNKFKEALLYCLMRESENSVSRDEKLSESFFEVGLLLMEILKYDGNKTAPIPQSKKIS